MILAVSTAFAATPADALGPHVGVAARGGYNKYGAWNMVTGGLEGRVYAGPVQILLGAEVYSVRRVLPPTLALETGVYSEWESIWPINLGAAYSLEIGPVRPYFGADLIGVRYYSDPQEWAFGGRVRAGGDYEIVPHLAANLNLGVGAWSGDAWDTIDDGTPNTGLLAQVSTGVVLSF